MEKMESSKKIQVLIFKLGKESYCLDTLSVQGVIRPQNLTKTDYPIKVSCLPFSVELLTDFEGKFIPIIDLRKTFILPQQKSIEDNRIILLDRDNIKIGIAVDSISGMLYIPQEIIYFFEVNNYSNNNIFSFFNVKKITNYEEYIYNMVI